MNKPYRFDLESNDNLETFDAVVETSAWIVVGAIIVAIYYFTFG